MPSKFLMRHWLRWPFDLLAVAVVMLLAWSSAFVYPTWSPDNYSQVFQLHQCKTIWAQLGRPLMDVLYCFVFRGQFQPQLQLFLGLACLFLMGLLIAKEWRLSPFERAFLICFVATFPFLCNVFGFETGKFSMPLAYLLATCSWSMVRGVAMRLKVLAVLVFCCGVLLYQTSINFLIVLALLSVIFDSDLCSMGLGFRRLLIRSGGRLVLLLAPGLALYLALSEAVRFWTRSGYNERYQWMRGPENLAGFASQLRDILAHYKHFLLPFHPMLPAFFGLTLLLAVFVVGFMSAYRALGYQACLSRIQATAILVFLPLSYFSVWATDLPVSGSLLGDGYRHTYPVVLVFTVTLIWAVRMLSGVPTVQAVVRWVMVVVIASFIVVDASWAFDTYRLSLFEFSVANRIAQKIEDSSAEHRVLYIVGGLPSASRPLGLNPRGYDVLGSGLDNPGAAAAVMRSVGLRFESPAPSRLPLCERLVPQANPVVVSPECNVINLSKL